MDQWFHSYLASNRTMETTNRLICCITHCLYQTCNVTNVNTHLKSYTQTPLDDIIIHKLNTWHTNISWKSQSSNNRLSCNLKNLILNSSSLFMKEFVHLMLGLTFRVWRLMKTWWPTWTLCVYAWECWPRPVGGVCNIMTTSFSNSTQSWE